MPASLKEAGADRNLLFGILALQMDFISKDALIKAMHAWVLDKARPLGQILVEQGALRQSRYTLLDPLVEEHIRQHGNDAQQSLAAVGAVGSARQVLEQVADPDVQASLARVSSGGPAEPDPCATRSDYLGAPTSEGRRFRILRPHAKGGLGQVFVALDEELRREVALKEIQDRHADDLDSRARFVREAEVTGGLEHPGIVPVYGLGSYANGRPFYAMRFIRGDSLKESIECFHKADVHGRDPGERALELRKLLGRFVDVCNAIGYAHSRGVLHRDLKPGNVMLGQYGETLVVDWGLAKAGSRSEQGGSASEAPLIPTEASGSTPTQMGQALGTPQYMSPEQAAGRLDQLGPASDVYSLGATLYCLLTGKAPFEDRDAGLVLRKVQKGDFPAPRQVKRDVPAGLEAVCLMAMALRPELRYTSARILADDIEHWLADDPVSAWREPRRVRAARWARRHRTLVTGVAAALVVAAASLAVATALLTAANEDLQTATGLAQTKAREAQDERDRARKEKEEADTQKGLALKAEHKEKTQRELADKRATELDEQTGRLAVTTGFAADNAWEAGQVEQAWDFLWAIPPERRAWEWRYRQRRFQGSYLTLYGHTRDVTSVAFSPDGQRLATASRDNTVRLWEAGSGRHLLTLFGHTGGIESVAFSPDGQRLATGSLDSTVRLWEAGSGRHLRTLTGHTGTVTSLAFSPDSQRLATGSGENTVRLWEASSGRHLLTLSGHTSFVNSVAFSPDGQRLATASFDKTVRLWEAGSGRHLLTLTGHTSEVRSVAFSPDGLSLATASWDRTVRLWEAGSGRHLLTLFGHTDGIESVAFSPDGQRLATASLDRTVRLWEAGSGRHLLTLSGHTDKILSVAFSPDGQRLATGGNDKTVRQWEAGSGRHVLTLTGHTGWVSSVAFSPDGKRLATGSEDNTVRLWEAASGRHLLTLTGHTRLVTSVAFSPDGKRLATGSLDKAVRLWEAGSGRHLLTLTGHTGLVDSVAFSPDGQRLATASWDNTVRLWEAVSGRHLLTLTGHTDFVMSVAFSPDGQRLATASRDQTVRLWEVGSGRHLLTLSGHTGIVRRVAFSADGQRLATASTDKTARLWEAVSGRHLLTFTGHTGPVTCVAFSADGQRLATGSRDNTVRLWEAVSGRHLLTLSGHTGIVRSVAFSPDGQRLATASDDQTVRLWEAGSGRHLPSLTGHTDTVVSVVFSPDGQRLATASKDKTVRLWEAGSGRHLLTLRGHTDWVKRVAFSPDSQRLATAGDNTVRLWEAGSGRHLFTLTGHTDIVAGVDFSPDGHRLFTSDIKGAVLAWDTQTGGRLPTPQALDTSAGEREFAARHPTQPVVAVPTGNRIDLVDTGPPTARERAFGEGMARFDPLWQREQALAQEKQQHWFAAAFHWGQLAEHEPGHEPHWQKLEAACAALGDIGPAMAACDRLLQKEPASAAIYFRRGFLRANQLDFYAATADTLAGLALAARTKRPDR